MHVFDYRFLKTAIPADIAGLSNIIYDLRARDVLRRAENESVFNGLRYAAIIDSVRSSNAIEGIVSTKKRIEELVYSASPKTHDEHEIIGYKVALDEIYSDGFHGELSEDLIKHLHFLLMQDTSPDAGMYKRTDNLIQERDAHGRISVRFRPVAAQDTPDAMQQLILAYREARQDSGISQLLLTACVIVDLLCIHPFMDGNGRVSRLITTVLLQESGFDIGRFISLERKIDEYKGNYYDSLKLSSEGWYENKNDYTPFITYLMQIIYACYKELDRRFVSGTSSKMPKKKMVEYLLLNAYVPISKQEIAASLPDVSITTIERVLGKMVKCGTVEKIGTYKDARYRKA